MILPAPAPCAETASAHATGIGERHEIPPSTATISNLSVSLRPKVWIGGYGPPQPSVKYAPKANPLSGGVPVLE